MLAAAQCTVYESICRTLWVTSICRFYYVDCIFMPQKACFTPIFLNFVDARFGLHIFKFLKKSQKFWILRIYLHIMLCTCGRNPIFPDGLQLKFWDPSNNSKNIRTSNKALLFLQRLANPCTAFRKCIPFYLWTYLRIVGKYNRNPSTWLHFLIRSLLLWSCKKSWTDH